MSIELGHFALAVALALGLALGILPLVGAHRHDTRLMAVAQPAAITQFLAILFAFSTILGWSYYGDRCVERLFGAKTTIFYRIAFTIGVYVGATIPLGIVWSFADIMNGLMALPNLVGLLLLSGLVVRETRVYFARPDWKDLTAEAH